ncbi:hypothetical protein [Streptosporangium sp. NPDC000396]|uniref:hypothetical protein n=1 Tax=Streptosporangium sp. NPDC000396 TaxID=3366185 RepID=UPI0036C14D1A
MVGDRYDIIEAEPPRGPRRWIGIAVLAALVAVPVFGLLTSREPDAVAPFPEPVPAPPRVTVTAVSNVLHPKPRYKNGREILDVVFPDGSKAEVSYPAELGLAKLGVRPAQGAWLDGYFSLFRQLTAPPGGPAEVSQGNPMIRRLSERVTLWQPTSAAEGHVLLFAFDPWYVALHDLKNGMTYEQRLLWAENLHGRVTKSGYLVLEGRPPVRLARPGQDFKGEQVGPQLWFGGARETLVVLVPVPGCDVRTIQLPMIEQRRRFSAETCQDGVYVAASGERGHVERVIAGIMIKAGA